MLKLLDFIHSNPDWETQLANAPYHVSVKRKNNFVLFKYTMYGSSGSSDLNIPMVRECRGIILDENNGYAPVCVPFFKFGNYGESYADDIDWTTARVVEKIDGSFIKVWHHKGEWQVSTNNNICAADAPVDKEGSTFRDIFDEAAVHSGLNLNSLETGFTYMFEMVSPKTQVVIPYTEAKLFHIATRNNTTFKEIEVDIGVAKPKTYDITSIEAVITAAKELDQYSEGFIVVDAQYRRLKVKSPLYVALHHVLTNAATDKSIIEIIRSGEVEEVLSYFPEHAPKFDAMRNKLEAFITQIEQEFATVQAKNFPTRKDLAAHVTKTTCPACIFAIIDGKSPSVRDFVMGMPINGLERFLARFCL
jgi:T4 RnlA family RNA ligase